ncbi:MAG: protein phosphatase CheZ [Hyphomicrobiaceae bacterium]|nr:protein phosphatase CheZ [Hyphomicrobiaceae bacterium]
MRSANKKIFRIERTTGQDAAQKPYIVPEKESGGSDEYAQARHQQVMDALAEINAKLSNPAAEQTGESDPAITEQVIESCQRDLREAQKIKDELQEIHEAIARTKQEIATLHRGEYQGVEISRMTNELSAIVDGTEQATENILQAAEQIDNDAGDLVAALRQDRNRNSASDIQDQVVKIFEACNFQDLTGQRISKVVTAFSFIEERVDRMMEIWGGLESFKNIELEESCTRDEDEALLNGPALEDDANIASQDDIDALFD